MQARHYASTVPALLAEMENQREAGGNEPQPPNPEEESEKVVYVYPLEGGGVVFTDTPIEEDGPPPPSLTRKRRRQTRALQPGGSLRIFCIFCSYSLCLLAWTASIRYSRPLLPL